MAWLWWCIASALAMPQAEVDRLSDEMKRLAARGAWSGVERNWMLVVEGGGQLEREAVLLAAQAARTSGDVLGRIERLAQAQALGPTDDVQASIDEILATHGRVQLVPGRRGGSLEVAELPFRPDEAQAIRFAQQTVSKGPFNGYLPAGDYVFDEESFTVTAGQPLLVLGARVEGEDVTVAGVRFPRRATVGGERLELNGVGVRAKFGINVYVGALYLTQRNWAAHRVIAQDGPKRLVMHFTHRLVTREQMADQFRQGLARQDIDPDDPAWTPFFAMLRDVERGERLVWEYVPGEGSTLRIGKDTPVHLPQPELAQAWLGIFLGSRPASETLKEGLLGGLR